MRILPLMPVSGCALEIGALAVMNPPMTYDSTLGTLAAQNAASPIVPPFQNLPAHIDDVNGVMGSFTWNYKLAKWN
jgi:hypothetical protein